MNKTTVNGLNVKREILEVWNEIDGPKLLAEWVVKNFADFLRILVKMLPAADVIQIERDADGIRLVFNAQRAEDVLGDLDDDDSYTLASPDQDPGGLASR